MHLLEDLQIPTPLRRDFEAMACEVSREEHLQFDARLPAAAAEARHAGQHWNVAAPSKVIDALVCSLDSYPWAPARLRRVAVARLVLRHFRVEDSLPPSVRALYPEFFGRLATHLKEFSQDEYSGEFFAKDVRYALGLTVPTGALQLDLRSRIGPKLIIRDAINSSSLRSMLAYAAAIGWSRWYGIHIDPRAMKEFSPDGWTASFTRMADTLKLNPAVRGVMGVSWFFDPRVEEISPRLAYVRSPTKLGAFLVRVGTGPHHTENALYRSPARRKLYDEGKYLPTCYLMAWPRRPLLSWALRLDADRSTGFGCAIRPHFVRDP